MSAKIRFTNKKKLEALEEIRKKNKDGKIEAEDVVEAARDERHILHSFFPWDDKKAAHQHRLDIARRLIKKVYVLTKTTKSIVKSIAYVRDPAAKTGYLSVAEPRSNVKKHEIIARELKHAWSIVDRLKDLAEAFDLDHETELLRRSLKTFEEAILEEVA